MFESQKPGSISPSRPLPGSVAASPFNGIKLGLAALLLGGALLGWVVEARVHAPWAQLAILAGYGLAVMAWGLRRTRRILRETWHGPQ